MKAPSMITTSGVVVSVVFPVLSLIAILLRVKARSKGRQPLKADDWWMLFTWFTALALSINLWVFAAISGVDYFKIDLVKGNQATAKLLLLTSAMDLIPLSAVKISILLFYKKIFTIRKFEIAVWVTIPVIALWGIIFFMVTLFQGKPVSAAWTGVGVLQFDTVTLGLAQCGSSIALDIIVLLFPIPIILGLHMATRRKIAIIGIFWLGILCVLIAILRVVYVKRSTQQAIDSAHGSDGAGYSMVFTLSKLIIFLILEPNCSVIAGCLPCYAPLFAGGRAPESIVRSVWSVVSLQSIRSAFSSRGGSTKDSGKGTANSVDYGYGKNSASESTTELREALPSWSMNPSNGSNNTHVAHVVDEELGGGLGSINVTRAVDVARS